METKQSAPQITDSALRLPGDFPTLPEEVIERFPSLGSWNRDASRFWNQNQNAMNDFARSVLDVTELAGVFVVDGSNKSIYVKGSRDQGGYADPDTPFYADREGYFSLKNKLTWNPATNELSVSGTIIATAGQIGGFDIGPDYIRDTGDSFGLASDTSGSPNVRFWAGSSFSARATAPFRVYDDGAIAAASGVIGGWTISATTLAASNAVLDSAGQLLLGTGNDVAILSATNATYRMWIGNATAGTAAFSVTKAGALFSTSGTIGGFTIGVGSLTAGTGATYIELSNTAGTGIILGDTSGPNALLRRSTGGATGLYLSRTGSTTTVGLENASTNNGRLTLSDSAGNLQFDIDSGHLFTGITFNGDTNLFRSAANTLRTDDNFIVGGTLTVSGAFSPSSISTGAISGTTGSFSSNVSVSGTLTSGAFSATTGTFSSNVSVSGTLSSGAFSATTGSFSSNVTVTGTLGSGAFSATTGSFSSNLTVGGTGSFTNSVTMNSGFLSVGSSSIIGGLGLTGAVTTGDGSTGAPAYSFASDTDTGWRLESAGAMRGVTSGSDRFVIRDAAIVCIADLKINNNKVGGSPTPGGYVTILEDSGATIQLITT